MLCTAGNHAQFRRLGGTTLGHWHGLRLALCRNGGCSIVLGSNGVAFTLGRPLLQKPLPHQAVGGNFTIGQRRIVIGDGEIALLDVEGIWFGGTPIKLGGTITIAADPDKRIQH